MPIYGACMIWKKSQIHLPFLLFVNICTNERAGRIQVMTYATFSKAGVLFWKKLIYFLSCNMEILTRKNDLCESVSSIIYLENVHSQTKNYIGLNSFLLKWTLDFTLLLDDQNFFRQFICVLVMEFKYDRPVSSSAFLVTIDVH